MDPTLATTLARAGLLAAAVPLALAASALAQEPPTTAPAPPLQVSRNLQVALGVNEDGTPRASAFSTTGGALTLPAQSFSDPFTNQPQDNFSGTGQGAAALVGPPLRAAPLLGPPPLARNYSREYPDPDAAPLLQPRNPSVQGVGELALRRGPLEINEGGVLLAQREIRPGVTAFAGVSWDDMPQIGLEGDRGAIIGIGGRIPLGAPRQ